MKTSKKIRVIVIDDSMLFRETIAKGIAKDSSIEVVGTAADPYKARDLIVDLEPDVLTLDVEMPIMNGIEFLRKLMPQYPLPVVVVSAVSSNVFDAMEAGAVDFVTKPDSSRIINADSFINELIVKIKIASTAKVSHHKSPLTSLNHVNRGGSAKKDFVIAIGASTGGTEALFEIVKSLPREVPPIVVVQHMPPVFTKLYAERLNSSCLLSVKEAEEGDVLIPGRVLIAPGDYHMTIQGAKGNYYVNCVKGEKVNGHCPSVDVLFNSVASTFGKNSIGIILTGMGYDGAKGLLNMKKTGAYTMGQDEKSSVVYGMPKVAFNIGAINKQVSLKAISEEILKYINT